MAYGAMRLTSGRHPPAPARARSCSRAGSGWGKTTLVGAGSARSGPCAPRTLRRKQQTHRQHGRRGAKTTTTWRWNFGRIITRRDDLVLYLSGHARQELFGSGDINEPRSARSGGGGALSPTTTQAADCFPADRLLLRRVIPFLIALNVFDAPATTRCRTSSCARPRHPSLRSFSAYALSTESGQGSPDHPIEHVLVYVTATPRA